MNTKDFKSSFALYSININYQINSNGKANFCSYADLKLL